jgi:alpha-mannosidase
MSYTEAIVRLAAADSMPAITAPMFSLAGAPNVMLETIKRGEEDDESYDSRTTIILRMFEQFGGHAKATLKMWVAFGATTRSYL